MNWKIEIDPRLWFIEGESHSEWCKRVNDTFNGGLLNYNPETHELVEKKEAKIKRLKEELEFNKQRIEHNKYSLETLGKLIGELEKENKEIKKQLKELED